MNRFVLPQTIKKFLNKNWTITTVCNEGQTALDWINLRLQWKNDDPELNKVKTILEEEYAKIDASEV